MARMSATHKVLLTFAFRTDYGMGHPHLALHRSVKKARAEMYALMMDIHPTWSGDLAYVDLDYVSNESVWRGTSVRISSWNKTRGLTEYATPPKKN